MLWHIVFVLSLVVIFVKIWEKRRIIIMSTQLKCGIKAWPLVGHAYLFTGNSEDRMNAFINFGQDTLKQGGVSKAWIGANLFAVIADPIEAKKVLAMNLGKGSLTDFVSDTVGNGIIFAPENIWRLHRKTIVSTFTSHNLKLFFEVFSKRSRTLVDQLQSHSDKGPFSIWSYISSFTLDSSCDNILDVQLITHFQKVDKFIKAFDTFGDIASFIVFKPWLHKDLLFKIIHPKIYKQAQNSAKVMCDFVDEIIKQKIEGKKQHEKYENKEKPVDTLLDKLITLLGIQGGYSRKELREELLSLITAGSDTSSVGICFTLCLLSKHPEVQEKVYKELQTIFEDTERQITWEDLQEMKYLDAVIKETLRLYPPVPFLMREIDKYVPLESGGELVPGTFAVISLWTIHRNPKYWGDDAEIFRPQRFLEKLNTNDFLTFGYRPRNCLGYQYAIIAAKTVISSVLRKYQILPASGAKNEPVKSFRLKVKIMLKDVDNFMLCLEKRKRV